MAFFTARSITPALTSYLLAKSSISGFDLDDKALNLLSKQLKQHCGTGGSDKDSVLIIQGDHRDTVKGLLEGQGYLVKLAGG